MTELYISKGRLFLAYRGKVFLCKKCYFILYFGVSFCRRKLFKADSLKRKITSIILSIVNTFVTTRQNFLISKYLNSRMPNFYIKTAGMLIWRNVVRYEWISLILRMRQWNKNKNIVLGQITLIEQAPN